MKRVFLLLWLLLTLAACGGGSSSTLSKAVTGVNVADLLVDSGPDGAGVNRLYTSVTICKPGSITLCKTIDHVLVDTGSVGLRLLASEVSADLQLSAATSTLTATLTLHETTFFCLKPEVSIPSL